MLVHECVSAVAAAVLYMLGPHEPLSIDARLVADQLIIAPLLHGTATTPRILRFRCARRVAFLHVLAAIETTPTMAIRAVRAG